MSELGSQPLKKLQSLRREGLITETIVQFMIEARVKTTMKSMGIDFNALMNQLERHSSYITGRFILSIVEPEVPTDDIDIHVPHKALRRIIEGMVNMGFMGKENGGGEMYVGDGPYTEGTIHLVNAQGVQANIISCGKHPLISILHHHTTVTMNYIAYHGLVMLYPDLTLRREGITNGGPTDVQDDADATVNKYKALGYTTTTALEWEHRCGVDPSCPQTLRTLHNSHTLHVRWPEYSISLKVREQSEGKKCIWQLASGRWCRKYMQEEDGMVMVNEECESKFH